MAKTCNGCCEKIHEEENSLAMDMIREYDRSLKIRTGLCIILFVIWVATTLCLTLQIDKNNKMSEELYEYKNAAVVTETDTNIRYDKPVKRRKSNTVRLRLVARETR